MTLPILIQKQQPGGKRLQQIWREVVFWISTEGWQNNDNLTRQQACAKTTKRLEKNPDELHDPNSSQSLEFHVISQPLFVLDDRSHPPDKMRWSLQVTAAVFWQEGRCSHCDLRLFNGINARRRRAEVTVGEDVSSTRNSPNHMTCWPVVNWRTATRLCLCVVCFYSMLVNKFNDKTKTNNEELSVSSLSDIWLAFAKTDQIWAVSLVFGDKYENLYL